MKKLKQLFTFILLCFTFCLVCNPVHSQAKAKINKTTKTIAIGQKYTLKMTGTKKHPKWASNNTQIATVSQSGKVTGKKSGQAIITARIGNKKYKCKITVKSVLSLSKKNITIDSGKSVKVYVTFKKPGTVYYKISNTDICSAKWGSWGADNKASYTCPLTIKAINPGTTKVTVTNTYNKEKKVITVTVRGSSQAANFQRIKNYIANYGSTNKSGNKFISKTYTYNGTTIKTGIIYNSATSTFTFDAILDSRLSSGDHLKQTYEMDVRVSNSYSSPETAGVFYDSSGYYYAGFSAYTNININTYNNNNTYTFIVENNSSGINLQNLCNTGLDVAFISWDMLVSDLFGININDLGFKNY